MSDEPLPAEERLLRLLERMRALGPASPPPDDADTPVTPAQLVLLDWIAASPGCRIQEVAAGLGLTPPTVSVGVRRLEEAGLLERRPNPRDRRSQRLFLTARGASLHQRAREFRWCKARRLLAGLSPQEQETLLSLWERALDGAAQNQEVEVCG